MQYRQFENMQVLIGLLCEFKNVFCGYDSLNGEQYQCDIMKAPSCVETRHVS